MSDSDTSYAFGSGIVWFTSPPRLLRIACGDGPAGLGLDPGNLGGP
jgi:hypothetical protein